MTDTDTADTDTAGTAADTHDAGDQHSEQDALVDAEIAELGALLDRVDGLTYEVRERLRRIQAHRHGVDPQWTARHR